MKYSILKAFSCGVMFLALTSCEDYLDQNPDERVDITTEEQVVQLLTSGYMQYNYGWVCELSSDNMIDNNSPHYPYDPDKDDVTVYYNLAPYERMDNEIFRFEPVVSSTGTDSPTTIWQGCYSAIATANHALEAIDKILLKNGNDTTDVLRAARAEALLIRAYHHFILVNVFSQAYKNDEASSHDVGIPYMKVVENTVHPNYERGTVTEVYKNIEEDLEAGLRDISDINYQMPKWHFNTNAAHAFAARFYLFKRDYDKVIQHADAVLGAGTGNLSSMLMTYDGFGDCTTTDDYSNAWQSPNLNNNLMLMPTYSLVMRRFLGNRYAWNGDPVTETIYRYGPNWTIMPLPVAFACGLFQSGEQDYGFVIIKVGERFEYTDRVAGIGYPHNIRREFTATELLLARAEAKILSANRDLAGAVADLSAYENTRWTLPEDLLNSYGNRHTLLTEDDILSYYSIATNPNCFENWDFTQNMSPDFVVPAELVPYMNCLNDMRRFETLHEGLRFFDLKRFGIEYSHSVGNPAEIITLAWDDPRRAIEVPQEVLAAGMESSRPLSHDEVSEASAEFRVKNNDK